MRNIAGNRTQGWAVRLKRLTARRADGYDTLLGKFLSTACALGNWDVHWAKILYIYIYIWGILRYQNSYSCLISEEYRDIYWNLFLLEF